jgi:iron complex transport system ATP-binding protein
VQARWERDNEMAVLTVQDLCFDYGDTPVLKGIDFSVDEGAICGLLGPNGSGKTTLLKCINGFLRPGRGHVVIRDKVVANLSRGVISRLMAVVPQMTVPAFSFTALQMVVMGRVARLGAFATPSEKHYREARTILADLGLTHLTQRGFNEMSGGERQMVLLARALFQNPKILLLDEPTAHLDFRNQYEVMDMVTRVTRERGLTTLVSLHDPNLAARYCTRMVMLKQGRVHRQGDIGEVFDCHSLEAMYGMAVSIETGCRGECFVMPSAKGGSGTWH